MPSFIVVFKVQTPTDNFKIFSYIRLQITRAIIPPAEIIESVMKNYRICLQMCINYERYFLSDIHFKIHWKLNYNNYIILNVHWSYKNIFWITSIWYIFLLPPKSGRPSCCTWYIIFPKSFDPNVKLIFSYERNIEKILT